MITRRGFAALVAALVVAPVRKLLPAKLWRADIAVEQTELFYQAGGTFEFSGDQAEALRNLPGVTIDGVQPNGNIIVTLKAEPYYKGNDDGAFEIRLRNKTSDYF